MKLKERIKNAGFWVSLISSVFLILGAFGIEIGDEVASSIINAVCSALVVFGIISDPTTGAGYLDKIEDNALAAVELPAVAAIKAAIDEAVSETSADAPVREEQIRTDGSDYPPCSDKDVHSVK